jgi:hypothetical protein
MWCAGMECERYLCIANGSPQYVTKYRTVAARREVAALGKATYDECGKQSTLPEESKGEKGKGAVAAGTI